MGVRRGSARVAADLPFVKDSRGAATVAHSVLAREPSTHPFSAANKSAVSGDARPFLKRKRETAAHGKIASPPGPKFTKAMRGGIVVEIGGGKALPNARSSLKRPRVMERGGEGFAMPCPDPGQLGILRKRMAVELDALHALLRKAELLSRRKNAAEPRKEEPVEAVSKTMPAAKRMKASPLEECEAGEVPAHEEKGLVDVRDGVSPVAIRCPSPAVSAKKTQETDNRESRITPEDEDEFVDICGGVSPIAFQKTVLLPVEDDGETDGSPSSSSSSSGSESSSSSSESDSDSDSDEEDNVHSPPAPPVFVPKEKSTTAQPLPELLASVPMQSTEPEEIEQLHSTEPKKVQDVQHAAPALKAVSMPGLIYRAKLRLALPTRASTSGSSSVSAL
ncbi:hypothetical protein BS78_04G190800 [Paspalum vaginatum]|nr:hypothetical protein BS78_04G190800 [Paspalum vaginatum]